MSISNPESSRNHVPAAAEGTEDLAAPSPSHVIGIGASAGGLEALETFFSHIDSATGAAFAVVQHLSPDFRSLVDELLARYTDMTIVTAADGMAVEPNVIYLMPPRVEMIIHGGRLLLTQAESRNGLTLPIDRFFRSLAQDCGEKSVAIVLSGTGSDGSRGIVDIQEAGGLVLAQHETSAKFDGMPKNARDSGVCDYLLPPEGLAQAVHEHIGIQSKDRTSLVHQDEPLTGLDRILAMLNDRFGTDFNHYKSGTVTRRLDRRVILARCADIDAYEEYLRQQPDELDLLYRDILVGVTHFFRDASAFEVLQRDYLTSLIEQTQEGEEIRVWTAGCATGQEAYSLAILFLEAMEACGIKRAIRIFATDLHQGSLDYAGSGQYSPSEVENVSPERLRKWFSFNGTHYTVRRQIRKMIVFARHNVIRDAPFTNLHLVSCRNLLIYLDTESQQKALSLFQFGLGNDGILFLGSSEHLGPLEAEFEVLDEHGKLFRKRRHAQLPTNLMTPKRPDRSESLNRVPTNSATRRRGDLLALYDAVLDQFMPMSFLVNDQRELLHCFGGASQFLCFRDGRQMLDICDSVVDELRPALISTLQQVSLDGEPAQFSGIRLTPRDSESACLFRLTAQPVVERKTGAQNYVLILTPEAGSEDIPISEPRKVKEVDSAVSLELELRYTRENLQATIEELETSNEELQATNEELIASNEELQSTNEELNSVNEELYTVNAEYQNKIVELTSVTNDMENLLVSTEIGTIFLDHDLSIRRYTPRAADFAQLMPQDIGRPLSAFANRLSHPELIDEIRKVAATGQPYEKQVESEDGRAFLVRLHPYIASGQPDGVVLTLVNVTRLAETQKELHQRTIELREVHERLEQRVAERTEQLQQLQRESQIRDEEFAHAARLNLLGEMLTGMAHELNQPLQAIIAFSSTLEQRISQGAPHSELVEPLQHVSSEASRAGGIIRKLRRLVQKREPQATRLHMNNLIRECLDLVQREIESQHVRVDLQLDPKLPMTVGDRIQLQQVVLNLVNNALQVMSDAALGDPRITISTSYDVHGNTILTSVENTGPVVSSEELHRLFEPFFTTRNDGLGLGLSIIRSIIDAHRGRIEVQPVRESGMRFSFYLPVSLDEESETETRKSGNSPGGSARPAPYDPPDV